MAYNPLESPVDFVIMRGERTPGLAVVEGAKRDIKVDEVGGYGASGSVSIVHGKRLVVFNVVITLLTAEDWAAWDDFKEVVLTMPVGPRAKALDVWHPWLALLDVRGCIVNSVSQPVPDDHGGFKITIACTEFRRPTQTLAAPVAAENKTPEQDPVEIYIGKLTDELQLQALAK